MSHFAPAFTDRPLSTQEVRRIVRAYLIDARRARFADRREFGRESKRGTAGHSNTLRGAAHDVRTILRNLHRLHPEAQDALTQSRVRTALGNLCKEGLARKVNRGGNRMGYHARSKRERLLAQRAAEKREKSRRVAEGAAEVLNRLGVEAEADRAGKVTISGADASALAHALLALRPLTSKGG